MSSELVEHEAAHCAAAYLLGRKIDGVSVIRIGDSDGRARIYTLRRPQTLEEALIDIQVFLIGDLHCGWQRPDLDYIEGGRAKEDEGLAWECAEKIPGITWREIPEVVELGRARACALLEREDFKLLHKALVTVLLERQAINGAAVERLFAERLEDFGDAPGTEDVATGDVCQAGGGEGSPSGSRPAGLRSGREPVPGAGQATEGRSRSYTSQTGMVEASRRAFSVAVSRSPSGE